MMLRYLVLIRGINVGGKNRVPMVQLRSELEALGFSDVSTYIASGNVLLSSSQTTEEVTRMVEYMLPKRFKLDDDLIKVHVITHEELNDVISHKPRGFGDDPDTYYSDVIFLIGINAADAFKVFDPREGVDRVWQGSGVIYSERLGAERTKSKLSKITQSPLYKSMTIRSWNTVIRLQALLESRRKD